MNRIIIVLAVVAISSTSAFAIADVDLTGRIVNVQINSQNNISTPHGTGQVFFVTLKVSGVLHRFFYSLENNGGKAFLALAISAMDNGQKVRITANNVPCDWPGTAYIMSLFAVSDETIPIY